MDKLTDDQLREEQFKRLRERLGYPYYTVTEREDMLRWIKLRRDRLRREKAESDELHEAWATKGESVPAALQRRYRETLLSMGEYMLHDLDFLLKQLGEDNDR